MAGKRDQGQEHGTYQHESLAGMGHPSRRSPVSRRPAATGLFAINPMVTAHESRKIAFYGGSFDPIHQGHLAIAHALLEQFTLDEFAFVPAFHAPHKIRLR